MHTKEPWIINSKCNDEVGTVSKNDDQSYGMIIPHVSTFGDNAKDDARRIMLCVNACATIPDEILERVISGELVLSTDIP